MAKYRVMTEQATYTPYFKVFEAPTMEEAENLAEAEIENIPMRRGLMDLGWDEGDSSTEYELRPDVTEEIAS